MTPTDPRAAAKAAARTALESAWDEVRGLSHTLHARPELGYVEYFAARTVTALLRRHGFEVDLGIARMPTAFRAAWRGGPGPSVALMAELDAIQLVDAKRPSWDTIGHGCGHNVMTAASVGAALALAGLGDGLPGRVLVFGSPAEETGLRSGGKELLRGGGWLQGVAAAMQIHPADRTYVRRPFWPGWSALELRFRHAAERPLAWDGAAPHPFEAVVEALAAVVPGALRLDVAAPPAGDDWTVADRTELVVTLQIQADGARTLQRREAEAIRVARGLADAHGLALRSALVRNRYDGMVDNLALGDAYLRNVQAMGEPIEETAHPHVASLGDMGNVSHAVPSIHPFVGMGRAVPGHSSAWAELAGGEGGDHALWVGALSLAWTSIDVLFDADLRHRAWDEYLADPRVDL
jgi:metal-dependent amidase/aminoacylase/carboxypeptidase family protein